MSQHSSSEGSSRGSGSRRTQQPPSTSGDPLYVIDEGPKPTEEETELFKQQVGEWLKLDDQVRKLMCAIRERRVHQRALASKVQEFMQKYKYDNLNTTQGVIRSTTRTVKQPLKINEVRTKIEEAFASGTAVADYRKLLENVFDGDRPVIIKQSLHRRIPRVSLSLDL